MLPQPHQARDNMDAGDGGWVACFLLVTVCLHLCVQLTSFSSEPADGIADAAVYINGDILLLPMSLTLNTVSPYGFLGVFQFPKFSLDTNLGWVELSFSKWSRWAWSPLTLCAFCQSLYSKTLFKIPGWAAKSSFSNNLLMLFLMLFLL